jgi:hypothetical protein
MGNGHAPGTAIGLGAAGSETTATGFGAGRSWEAGLAVFFFAAFFIAGFLAGFFLPGCVRVAGSFWASFVLLAGFFFACLARAPAFFLAAAFRDLAFTAALAPVADLRAAFFIGLPLRKTFFFAGFFLADFFLLAIRTSVC